MAEKITLQDDNHPYRVIAKETVKKILETLEERGTLDFLEDLETEDDIVLIIDSTMKAYRHQNYEKYRNQRVAVEVGGLLVDCFVHDIKVVDGTVQYQVKPVAGSKAIWVSRFAEAK